MKSPEDAFFFFFLADWEKNWVQSAHKGKEFGPFKLTAGKFYGDAEKDKGIQTGQVKFLLFRDLLVVTQLSEFLLMFRAV